MILSSRWKEIRTGSRGIITYLSIADFFVAFGYIAGSLNYSINFDTDPCTLFNYVCEIQSFLTTTSSLCSFFWTCSLAIYLYLSLVHNQVAFAQKLFPAFHVINWGVPVVITVPILATGYLGHSYFAASTWCYIERKHNGIQADRDIEKALVMMAGKLWEILTYLVVIVFYILIKRHISIQVKFL